MKDTRSAKKAVKQIEKDCLPRLEKYEQQTKVLAFSACCDIPPDNSTGRKKGLPEKKVQTAPA